MRFIRTKHFKYIVVASFLILTAILRGYNMFNYPAYREDEGTYVSQAWSVLKQGELAPYTYWYDHAPGGWIQMAGWHALVGFNKFGASVNSGRVLALLVQVITGWLIFNIIKKITGNFSAALIGLAIFAFSPLGISSQRRVLLDNFMIFWLLVSINWLVGKKITLLHIIGSALSFGLAFLSKETALIFMPLLALTAYKNTASESKRFALGIWSTIAVLVVFLFPLLALYKEELFPQGTLLGGNHPHVSLWEAVLFQLDRSGGYLWDAQSNIRQVFADSWFRTDPFFILFGLVSLIFVLFAHSKQYKLLGLLELIYITYLIRGGVVLDWYIIPLIPLFSVTLGLMFADIYKAFQRKGYYAPIAAVLFSSVFVLPVIFNLYYSKELFLANETVNQTQAVKWIKENLPSSALIVMDNYAYVDFRENVFSNSRFNNAHYYWKVEQDPAVRLSLLKDDWRNADYILVTRAVEETVQLDNLKFTKTILDHSTPIATFSASKYLEKPYSVEIREVNSERKFLRFSWQWYKDHFISDIGQVTDTSAGGITTSEGQSYAMLRAIWMNDRDTFHKVWSWTKENTQGSFGTPLFAWKTQGRGNEFRIVDESSASDADVDIALALLFAAKKWENDVYLYEAQTIMNAVWEYETAELPNGRILLAGNWVKDDPTYTINPSYFAPYAFRIFAKVQPNKGWEKLVDGTYNMIDTCSLQSAGNVAPDWCFIDHSGKLSNDKTQTGLNNNRYSYDAQRLPWRLALDYLWFNDRRSLDVLIKMELFRNEWARNNTVYAVYNSEGSNIGSNEALSQYSSLLGYFQLTKNEEAAKIYEQKIKPAMVMDQSGVYWGESTGYYDQNWVWFGLALYEGYLENLWEYMPDNTRAIVSNE